MKKLLILIFVVLLSSGFVQAKTYTNYCNDGSIVACYTVQENSGTLLVDHSANGYNGTFASSGHPAWTTAAPTRSYLAYSLTYSSSSDTMDLGTSNIFWKPSQAQSFVGWIFPTSDTVGAGSNPRILSRVTGTNAEDQFEIDPTKALFFSKAGSTNTTRQSNNNVLTLNAWNHVALVTDGSTTAANWHIYVNGSEVTYSSTTNGASEQDNTVGSLSLGNRLTDAARNLSGKLTECAFFSRQLSSAEVLDIYNNGLIQTPFNAGNYLNRAQLNRAMIGR